MLEWGEEATLSIRVQCDLLSLSRSSVYYHPAAISPLKLSIFHRIDEVYTEHPTYGGWGIWAVLIREGHGISESTVRRYMRIMGISAIYPKPNLSRRNGKDGIYPYLLRGVKAAYRDHIWGTDITYIRLRKGFMYLVVFMDWFSRYVITWELSDTLESDFVVKALERALTTATPEIMNSDQGSQFTSLRYIHTLKASGVQISMDGRGRCMDNIFTERLWRTVKYEEVYLAEYESPKQARMGLGRFFVDYNTFRPHSSLNGLTPHEVYFGNYTRFDFEKS